jgi:hypothetical protein
LRRHFEVVGFSESLDRSVKTVEDDFHRAVGIASESWAASERREEAAGGTLAIGCMAGGAIKGVKLPAILSGEWGGESEEKEQAGTHDGETLRGGEFYRLGRSWLRYFTSRAAR